MDYVVTLIAAREATPLRPSIVNLVRDMVRGASPITLSEAEAVDIPCAEKPKAAAIRAALSGERVDFAISPAANRRKRVLVADMDSTIVTTETLDDMAAIAGFGDQVAEITRRSMNGEIEFADSLRLRVALLKGKKLDLLEKAWAHVELMPGARELVATMRANGAVTALVSGGFTWFTSRVADLCGFDSNHANVLLHEGDTLTGEVSEPILDRNAKLTQLQRICAAQNFTLDQAATIGDGANDLAMIEAAGMGVAYHGKPIVQQRAAYRIDHADLRALLFMQGYRLVDFC